MHAENPDSDVITLPSYMEPFVRSSWPPDVPVHSEVSLSEAARVTAFKANALTNMMDCDYRTGDIMIVGRRLVFRDDA